MPRCEVGTRVTAVRDATDTHAHVYGHGTYDGDHPCEALFNIPNPRITLDDGSVVWGCQCWWGPEEQVQERLLKGKTVIYVKLAG